MTLSSRHESKPVYVRLRDIIAEAILSGQFADGDPLPSVRAFAAEQGANPLTVAKAYQGFQDEGLIVVKRLVMQGFIVMDYDDRRDEALADLQSWVASGQLKVQEDVIAGLENTPQALIGLLAGDNRGKRMVRL